MLSSRWRALADLVAEARDAAPAWELVRARAALAWELDLGWAICVKFLCNV